MKKRSERSAGIVNKLYYRLFFIGQLKREYRCVLKCIAFLALNRKYLMAKRFPYSLWVCLYVYVRSDFSFQIVPLILKWIFVLILPSPKKATKFSIILTYDFYKIISQSIFNHKLTLPFLANQIYSLHVNKKKILCRHITFSFILSKLFSFSLARPSMQHFHFFFFFHNFPFFIFDDNIDYMIF